eukprot:1956450-Pleurochrysis_carterae.AAC.1
MEAAESCCACSRLKQMPPPPAASTATSATIAAMLHSHDVRGISEPSVAAFNVFVHSIQRLNHSLPASARLPDIVLSEKIANAVRRLSDSLSTSLDVKLALTTGVGNLALTISAARGVLSDTEARNVRRELESNPSSLYTLSPSAARKTAPDLRIQSGHDLSQTRSGATSGHPADGAKVRTGTKIAHSARQRRQA